MNIAKLMEDLKISEGRRLKPYHDSVGKLTVGYGRNLDDVGVSLEEAETMLENDVLRTVADLNRFMPWWSRLDEVRQRVICDMAFNMGVMGLATFTNALVAVQAGRYQDAAEEMLRSLWARQVGPRAIRLAGMMQTGQEIAQ